MRAILTIRVNLPEEIQSEREAQQFISDMDYQMTYLDELGQPVILDTDIHDVEIRL